MLRINGNNLKDVKAPAYASIALGFAGIGDAFLYPFLPVDFASVNVSVAWVGLILSINRLIRILFNSFIVKLLGKYGFRIMTIAAVIIAILSTAGYALATGIYAWLLLRICWGLSFSAMRMSTIGYALQHNKQGFALGFTKSIQESGPMFCLFIAPVLLHYFNPRDIFLILGLLSLPALYFAFNLPEAHDEMHRPTPSIFSKVPSTFNMITFLSSFLIDGMIVVVLGLLFLRYGYDRTLIKAASVAAFYLGYKKVCSVAISPFGGIVADKIGLAKTFNICVAGVIIGFLLLMSGKLGAGAIVLFTFYGVVSAITPGTVSKNEANVLAAVAENATWRDIGSAVGTLVGGMLLSSEYLIQFLHVSIGILIILFTMNLLKGSFSRKIFYIWK
jgi:MFS family permease